MDIVVPTCVACRKRCVGVPRSNAQLMGARSRAGIAWLCPGCMEFTEPILGGGHIVYVCPACGSDEYYVNPEMYCVCAGCGSAVPDFGGDGMDDRIHALYKRVFYFNELISQLMLCEPAIPAELLDLLRAAYARRSWTSLSRARVHELCRSVSLAGDHKIPSCFHIRLTKECSIGFSARTGRPLTDLRKFGEKVRRAP